MDPPSWSEVLGGLRRLYRDEGYLPRYPNEKVSASSGESAIVVMPDSIVI